MRITDSVEQNGQWGWDTGNESKKVDYWWIKVEEILSYINAME